MFWSQTVLITVLVAGAWAEPLPQDYSYGYGFSVISDSPVSSISTDSSFSTQTSIAPTSSPPFQYSTANFSVTGPRSSGTGLGITTSVSAAGDPTSVSSLSQVNTSSTVSGRDPTSVSTYAGTFSSPVPSGVATLSSVSYFSNPPYGNGTSTFSAAGTASLGGYPGSHAASGFSTDPASSSTETIFRTIETTLVVTGVYSTGAGLTGAPTSRPSGIVPTGGTSSLSSGPFGNSTSPATYLYSLPGTSPFVLPSASYYISKPTLSTRQNSNATFKPSAISTGAITTTSNLNSTTYYSAPYINSTGFGTVFTPLGSGISSIKSSAGTGLPSIIVSYPYGNDTSLLLASSGTGTVISKPINTGASGTVSTISLSSALYGNGTLSTPPSSGFISSTSVVSSGFSVNGLPTSTPILATTMPTTPDASSRLSYTFATLHASSSYDDKTSQKGPWDPKPTPSQVYPVWSYAVNYE